ncbi:hypothetical protein PsAD37_03426 [Pseudovibrio sp. Ad37]|nr:hypothetical protein PsAD37_03426 [Pseudovibrio sp. Ad37]KZL25448.1 hypothetical protein PsWM33_01952 [Pseudovibrio sp. WM33]
MKKAMREGLMHIETLDELAHIYFKRREGEAQSSDCKVALLGRISC